MDLLDFRAAFTDDASHAGVGDDEFDGDGSRARNRGNVVRFVVDTSNNQTKRLGVNGHVADDMVERLTLATASSGPETFKIRSGLPGMDSETVTRDPDFSCLSQLCETFSKRV